ncbi:hypothetical protein [Psychrobium sp. 1_MG-2023]|uniref:hypothetical protein n=1 Tax=Psychrobium sp. 1_MG-2023 TaxID=3062624 RepID=UPI0027373C2A|nr:hypothetical protein [Psychrobium sp. 1_MG-2023]MDP2561226.1 hypothetical protein [Psychrobium sp. 1_MG-2023]
MPFEFDSTLAMLLMLFAFTYDQRSKKEMKAKKLLEVPDIGGLTHLSIIFGFPFIYFIADWFQLGLINQAMVDELINRYFHYPIFFGSLLLIYLTERIYRSLKNLKNKRHSNQSSGLK